MIYASELTLRLSDRGLGFGHSRDLERARPAALFVGMGEFDRAHYRDVLHVNDPERLRVPRNHPTLGGD